MLLGSGPAESSQAVNAAALDCMADGPARWLPCLCCCKAAADPLVLDC